MSRRSVPAVVLLTDFGLSGPYVGQMKGVLLGRAPRVPVLDLCHGVPAQDVRAGAFLLAASAPFFPEGSLFVCVVDPGVGTGRRVLWASDGRAQYLAPDNGLLSGVAVRESRAVEDRGLFLPQVSATFHGRDVFAPVAAALANGLDPRRLGPHAGPRPLAGAVPRRRGEGTVVWVDPFGSAVTDLPAAELRPGAAILHGRRRLGALKRTYEEAAPGRPLALAGSFGTVELAVRGGSYAARFKARPGDRVRAS